MKKYHVYGIGAALVDTEIEVTDQDLANFGIEKGLMTLVDEARQQELVEHLEGHLVTAKKACGGSAANSVIAASYFGSNTFYSCKVASDQNGQFYLDDMRAAGVATKDSLNPEDGTTGKCLVLITPDAERTMNTYLGISEQLSDIEVCEESIKASEYLYMEGYLVTSPSCRAAAIKARQVAEANGVKTAISLSDPGMVEFFKDGLQEMVGNGVDLLFCNEAEALGWTGAESIEAAAEQLRQTAKQFAITLGAKGALVFDGEQSLTIAPNAVTAIDTNGAGDMFAGAFLHAISQGHNFQQAGDLASLASAQVVSNYGPRLAADKHAELLKKVLA